MSLVSPVLEYESVCWDPCREGQLNVLGRVQQKAAQFTDHTKDSDWGTWFSVGRQHDYVHFLKRTEGNGSGMLYVTG
jgi:hypothetical protein